MRKSQASNGNQTKEHEGVASHIDCRTADVWEEKPADNATNDVAS